MKVVIIGNGISGITAARFIRKLSDHQIVVISNEGEYFFSRTALMYIYMGHMRKEDTKPYEDWFWQKNRIDLVKGEVTTIQSADKSLLLDNGESISYDKLIIATGSKPNKFGWPGQDLRGVGGLYHMQDLDRMERYTKGNRRAVIVGGGLIGIEMAEMFHSRGIPVTFLVREASFWDNVLPIEESQMVTRHIMKHHIDLRLGVNLQEIVGDNNGVAKGVVVKETGEEIDCDFVGLTAGVSPNIDFVKAIDSIETGRGILVDQQLQTSAPDIYAIGDCAELRTPETGRRGVEAIWYTGRMMGETVAYTICGTPVNYSPGLWFNSAKFMDIEYQVYGSVPAKLPEGISTFYWEHADGEKSVRIVYDKATEAVLGFNVMGIRFRHEVCEQWIKSKTHIDTVMEQLALANFDPEFYKKHEKEIISQYNTEMNRNIRLKSKRRLDRVLSFLQKTP